MKFERNFDNNSYTIIIPHTVQSILYNKTYLDLVDICFFPLPSVHRHLTQIQYTFVYAYMHLTQIQYMLLYAT